MAESCLPVYLRTIPFFFQAEDGIRDWSVTGVQTCALPICFDLPVVRQRIVCCLVDQGVQLGCTGSRRPAREFPQVERFPRFLAELRFQNLHSRGFVGKIDTHFYVKSTFPN